MPSKKKKAPSKTSNTIRIIGGQWRGRKLPVANEEGLRPTGDRLRETLFSWLSPYLHGARCLDAFAGTGALGFEALSRGAASAHFIELHRGTSAQTSSNITLLKANARVENTAFDLWRPDHEQQFDLVFIDPPFAQNLWQKSLDHLQACHCLAKGAVVYLEAPTDTIITAPQEWALLKDKTMGQVRARLYETNPHEPG